MIPLWFWFVFFPLDFAFGYCIAGFIDGLVNP